MIIDEIYVLLVMAMY